MRHITHKMEMLIKVYIFMYNFFENELRLELNIKSSPHKLA